jgi:hypothetical protein
VQTVVADPDRFRDASGAYRFYLRFDPVVAVSDSPTEQAIFGGVDVDLEGTIR